MIGFLGIDVSKGYADFELLNDKKVALEKGFQNYDTCNGHEDLLEKLQIFQSSHGLTKVVCGLESTGGYENNWYRSLSRAAPLLGLEVYRLNPMGVAYQGKSERLRTLTDSVSARTISRYLCDKYEHLAKLPRVDSSLLYARKFYHYIQGLLREKTRLNNQLEKLIYDGFPELIPYMRHGMSQWLLSLLSSYPGSGPVSRARVSSLVKIKGISLEKAHILREKAKNSIGQKDDILLSRTIQRLAQSMIDLTKQVKEEKAFLVQNYSSKEVELLTNIKGIGAYTAIGAMMEIEDVNKFKSASSMAAFFGLHPEFKMSGDGKTKAKMSKKGRAAYRGIIYMAARNVVLHNPYFKKIYARFRAKGMKDKQALGVIMNKLTRVFYGVLKSGKAFDPKIDQKNQQKTNNKKHDNNTTEQKKDAIREELTKLQQAPCSKRAYKKSKAELLPQTSNKEANTRSGNST